MIVRLDPDYPHNMRSWVELYTGGEIVYQCRRVPGLLTLRVPTGAADVAMAVLSDNFPGVRYVFPDYIGKLAANDPDDPLFGDQWHHDAIRTPCAWTVVKNAHPSIIVAVLDSGIDYTEPEFVNNLWVNEDELNGTPDYDDDNNGYIDDIYGFGFGAFDNGNSPAGDVYSEAQHGNVISQIIAGEGNNELGGCGIAWTATLLHVRVVDNQGFSVSKVLEAIEYALDNNAKIINISLVFEAQFIPSPYTDPIYEIMLAAEEMDEALFVVAAGNDGLDIENWHPFHGPLYSYLFPQSYAHSLANGIVVANSDEDDDRESSSNFGPNTVSLAAPGTNIVTGHATDGGTSFSAPMVAGVAALVWSENLAWGAAQVKDRILSTVRPNANWTGLTVTEGILDAAAAVGATCDP